MDAKRSGKHCVAYGRDNTPSSTVSLHKFPKQTEITLIANWHAIAVAALTPEIKRAFKPYTAKVKEESYSCHKLMIAS